MAVIGDAAKTPSSPPVDESRGCGGAMVLDNAQWLDHNRCAFYAGAPPLRFAGETVPMKLGFEQFTRNKLEPQGTGVALM